MNGYEYFLTAAKVLNFTKAAELLYISQPALTKYIKRLEESYGVEFFDRSTNPLKLTYAGEIYKEYAENCVRQELMLRDRLTEVKDDEEGKIKLGITIFRGSILLPEVLPVFKARFPKVVVELYEGTSTELASKLLNEEIDFCISNPSDVTNFKQLNYELLYKEKMYLCVSTDYCGLDRFELDTEWVKEMNDQDQYPVFDVSRLEEEPFFMTNSRQSMTYVVENALSQKGIYLKNVFRSSNLSTVINMVGAGMGFAVVPFISKRKDIYPNNLLYFRVFEEDVTWEHVVFFRKNAFISRHVRNFVDVMKELYR